MTFARPVADAEREPHAAVHEYVDIDRIVPEAIDRFALFVVVNARQVCDGIEGRRRQPLEELGLGECMECGWIGCHRMCLGNRRDRAPELRTDP